MKQTPNCKIYGDLVYLVLPKDPALWGWEPTWYLHIEDTVVTLYTSSEVHPDQVTYNRIFVTRVPLLARLLSWASHLWYFLEEDMDRSR